MVHARVIQALLVQATALPLPQLAGQPPASRPTLSGPRETSTDGTLLLTWRPGSGEASATAGADVSYELEEAEVGEHGGHATPTRIDAGPHLAAALSGRDDGLYRYRVRSVQAAGPAGPFSDPIEVRVKHHPLSLAFALFGVGAIVFLATAGLVLSGHRRTGRPPRAR